MFKIAYDRYVKLWDTETGDCIKSFTNHKVLYCVKFNPEEEKQHLFVAGTADKKIVCVSEKGSFIICYIQCNIYTKLIYN